MIAKSILEQSGYKEFNFLFRRAVFESLPLVIHHSQKFTIMTLFSALQLIELGIYK